MNRSGMKRGLAATAVSALAVTGITLGMPNSASAAGGVDFVTQQDSSTGSVQFDGANNTIKLEATGPAAAAKMLFELSTNGGTTYTDIATVSPVAGLPVGSQKLFSYEWTPSVSLYNTNVVVRARGISSVDTPISGVFDIQSIYVSTTDRAVGISNAPASDLGVYKRPGSSRYNGIVSGATSDIVGGASVDVDSYTGTGGYTGADFFGPVANGSRPFSGVADFVDTNIDPVFGNPVTGDYALARAEDDSDDVVPVKLYTQTIGSGTNATVNRTLIPVGETATVTVTVLDQKGAPVAGARVRREGGPAIPQLTNSRGQATFAGLTPSPAGTTYRYYVDNNDNNNYEEATEYARTFTISSYVATAASISASSDLGPAWDRDETAGVTINVKDQNLQDFGPQQVQYQWSVVPDSGAPQTFGVQTANVAGFGPNKGNANIGDVPSNAEGVWTLKTWIESNGNPGYNGDTVGKSQDFKVGQAKVVWDDGTVQQSPIGTVGKVYSGKLVLGDNTTVLGNRTFDVNLGDQNGAENAVIAAQAAQPNGTTRAPVFPNGDTQASVVTKADGTFGVAVSDPSGVAGSLEDRSLNAAGGDYAPSKKLEIDFMDVAVDHLTQDATAAAVDLGDGNTSKVAGRPVVVGDIKAYNQYNQLLTDVEGNVSVDDGYLTPYGTTADQSSLTKLTPASAPVAGQAIGAWQDLGTTKPFRTADGDAITGGALRGNASKTYDSVVGRSTGFDDNGLTSIKTTAAAAGKTAAQSNTFSSSSPLNPGDVKLSFSSSNESRILPKAPTTTGGGLTALEVKSDLVVTDQFGNRTNQTVDLTDDDATATVTPSAAGQFIGDPAAVTAKSSPLDSSNQKITGTIANPTRHTWKVTTPALPAQPYFVNSTTNTTPDVTSNDLTINWYTVDLANSVYTMTHSGTGDRLVGDSVTETYSAQDQNGQPLKGYHTELFRTGPDKLQNGNPQTQLLTTSTNADGKSVYTFQGAAAGKAILAGVLFNGVDSAPAEASRKNDTVTFVEPTQPGETKTPITATLTLSNNSTGNDVFKVKTVPAAKGALVTYYKFLVSGTKVKIGTGTIGTDGTANFTFADKFKNTNARYSATVSEGATTQSNYTKRVTIK
ncbi:MAG: hypothetical protein JWQ74_1238 [Marmoricola sp.]|nr:hypothetical protein [Marmoricola sp.]